MAELTGFEPAISCVTGRHVRPLHHSSKVLVENSGFEPLTLALPARCSTAELIPHEKASQNRDSAFSQRGLPLSYGPEMHFRQRAVYYVPASNTTLREICLRTPRIGSDAGSYRGNDVVEISSAQNVQPSILKRLVAINVKTTASPTSTA